MNASEVSSLLRHEVKQYGDPSCIRASETAESCAARQTQTIRDLLDQLCRFVTDAELRDECLATAERLMKRGFHRAAYQACLTTFAASAKQSSEKEAQRLLRPDAEPRVLTNAERLAELAQSTRGVFLTSVSRFHMVYAADSIIESKATLAALVKECEAIANAMKAIFKDDDPLYYLIQAGTVYLVECSLLLMAAGCQKQARVFVGWSAACLDATVKLCTTHYLPWRVRVYSTLCHCYEAAEYYAGALSIAQQCLARVDDLYHLEHIDVVPPSAHHESILLRERRNARLLVAKFAALAGADALNAAAEANLEAAPAKGGKGAAAAKGGKGGADAAATATSAAGGAGGNSDFAPNMTPVASAQDLLERVRAALQPAPKEPGAMQGLTVQALLTLAGGSPQRIKTDVPLSAGRTHFNLICAEALALVLTPGLEQYVNTNRGRLPVDLPSLADAGAAAAALDSDAKKPGGKAGGKGAAAADAKKPGGKNAAATAAADAGDDAAPVASAPLETWVDIESLEMGARLFLLHLQAKPPLSEPFRVVCAVIKDMARYFMYDDTEDNTAANAAMSNKASAATKSALKSANAATKNNTTNNKSVHPYEVRSGTKGAMKDAPAQQQHHAAAPAFVLRSVQRHDADSAALDAEILLHLVAVQGFANGYRPPVARTPTLERMFDPPPLDPFLSSSRDLAMALLSASASQSFLDRRRDVLEDASLLLLRSWHKAIAVPHEHSMTPEILGSCVRCLVAAGHDDVLAIANTAAPAIARLEEASQLREALLLAVRAESALAARQVAYCTSHDGSGTLASVDDAVTPATVVTVTTEGGVWLKSVRDMRTLLRCTIARLRLKTCQAEQEEELRRSHDAKLALLKDREAKSHIFGALSLKEQRAMALMAEPDLPKNLSVDAMERRLHGNAGGDPSLDAIVFLEASAFQVGAGKRRHHLKAALDCLDAADAAQAKLILTTAPLGATRGNGTAGAGGSAVASNTVSRQSSRKAQDALQAAIAALATDLSCDAVITSTAVSNLLLWCQAARCAARDGEFDLVLERIYPRFAALFVTLGDTAQKAWNKNVAAWDTLKHDAAAASSSPFLQELADALTAVAKAKLAMVPKIGAADYVDSIVSGADPARFTLNERQLSSLRAGNAALHALDVALAVGDEGRLLAAAHVVYESLMPMMEAETPSSFVLRPTVAVLHALTTGLTPRRWTDAGLQLLAARVLQAAIQTVSGLPEQSQPAVVAHISHAFAHVWKAVMAHPNARQQTHIRIATADLDFVRRVLKGLKIESANEGADAAPAAAAGAKGGKPAAPAKPAAKSAAAAAAAVPTEAKATTVFLRHGLSTGDLVPLEFLELLDTFLFAKPFNTVAVPILIADSPISATPAKDVDASELFPSAVLVIADLLARGNPLAAVQRLADLKVSVHYPKLALQVCLALVRHRELDAALSLANDVVVEIRQRHLAITNLEAEHLSLLQHIRHDDADAPMSPRSRSKAVLSKRISLLRRRVAFAKIRSLGRQFDVPVHAAIHEVRATILFYQQRRAAIAPPPPPTAQAPADGKGGAKAPAPKPSAPPTAAPAAKGDAGSKTPRGVTTAAPVEEPVELPLAEKLKIDAVDAAARAVVLYARCFKWRSMFAALEGLVNMARAFYGPTPKTVLVDVLAMAAKLQNLDPSLSVATSTATTPAPVGVPKVGADGFYRVEQQMKVICSEIIAFVDRVTNGTGRPDLELEFMQHAAIKTGRDCDVFGQLLARTTSLLMYLSDDGQRIAQKYAASEAAATNRYEKIFRRERQEIEERELAGRETIATDWQHGFWQITKDPRADDSDEDETNSVVTRTSTTGSSVVRAGGGKGKRGGKTVKVRSSSADARNRALTVQVRNVDDVSPLDAYLKGPLNIVALGNYFAFAAQCLQYHRLKLSAISLTLEFSGKTEGRFASQLLPYVMNLQNATNQPFVDTLRVYEETTRDEVRTAKLTNAAVKAWEGYQSSEAFKRALGRASATLMPAKRAALGFAPIAPGMQHETGSATTGTTAGQGGPSAYREVVQQYHTAIASLRQKQQLETLVPLLVQLGNIHLLHRLRNEAERAWTDAVDATLGRVNAVASWRQALESLGLQATVKAGYLKMLASCAALCNLAMYVYAEDQAKCIDACLLCAVLLWRCMATSMTAPQRLWDAPLANATWVKEIMAGLGWGGIEGKLLPELGHGLVYVARHLERVGYYAQAITVSTALEVLAIQALRSADLAIQARCVRARAAAQMGHFDAALQQLHVLLRGRSLPDAALTHLDILIDASDKDAKASNSGGAAGAAGGKGGAAGGGAKPSASAPTAGAGGGKKGGQVESTSAINEDGSLPLYNNALPPTDEANIRAIDGLLTLLGNGGTTLNDGVAGAYGPTNSRTVLLATAAVLSAIGASDESMPWYAAAALEDPNAAFGGGAPAGGGAKGGAAKPAAKGATNATSAAGAGDAVKDSACNAAILAADRITVAGLATVTARPKSAPLSGPGARAATPPNAPGAGNAASAAGSAPAATTNAAEDHWYTLELTAQSAKIRLATGSYLGCIEACEAIIHAQDSVRQDQISQLALNVPSYAYAVDAVTLLQAYGIAAEAYLRQSRLEAAMTAAHRGLAIAEAVNDAFAVRIFQRLLARGQAATGLIEDAALRLKASVATAAPLEYKGFDAQLATSVVASTTLDWALRLEPEAGRDAAVLASVFDGTAATTATADAGSKGTKAAAAPTASGQSPAAMLTAASSSLALATYHSGGDPALSAAQPLQVQCYAQANPFTRRMVAAAVLAARQQIRLNSVASAQDVLRQALALAPQSFDAAAYPHAVAWAELSLASTLRIAAEARVNVVKVPTSERTEAIKALLDTGALPPIPNAHLIEQRLKLLGSALQSAVTKGTHDHELIRHCLLEAAAAYTTLPHAGAHLIAFGLVHMACTVCRMQGLLASNAASVLGADANPPLPADVEAGLPPAVIEAIDDASRRAYQGQGGFASANAANSVTYTGVAPPAPQRPKFSAQHVLQVLADLHGALASATDAGETRRIEALLSTLRSTIQKLQTSFSAPVLLAAPPALTAAPEPSLWRQPYLVAVQNMVADATHMAEVTIQNETSRVAPHCTMVMALWPNGDDATEKAAVPAAGEKGAKAGAAAAKATKGAAVELPVATSPTKLVKPPVLAAIDIAQATLRSVHNKAKAVLRELTALTAGPASLDEALDAALAVAGGVGGKGEKGGAAAKPEGGKGKDGKGAAAATAVAANPGDDDSIAQAAAAQAKEQRDAQMRTVQERKGEVLLSLLEGIAAAKLGAAGFSAKDVRPLYPTFQLEAHHVHKIALLTDPRGGASFHGDEPFCQWLVQIATAVEAMGRKQNNGSGGASSAPPPATTTTTSQR